MVERLYLSTFETPVCIKLACSVEKKQNLSFKGFDPAKPSTIFYKRQVPIEKGTTELEFPMPFTSERLCIEVKGESFDISKLKAEGLYTKPLLFSGPEDIEFYNFAKDFCKNVKYKKIGIHESDQGNFAIQLSEVIKDDQTGKPLKTPAVTYMDNGLIELSKQVIEPMTCYMIMLILLHERMHFKLNTFDEELCDQYAGKEYNSMGFPSNEGIKAFIDVFKPVNEKHEEALIKRTEKLYNTLNQVTPNLKHNEY